MGGMSEHFTVVYTAAEASETSESPASTLKADEVRTDSGQGVDEGGDTAAGTGLDHGTPPGLNAETGIGTDHADDLPS